MTAKKVVEGILAYTGLSAPVLASRWGMTAQAVYDMLRGKTTRISPRLRAIIARDMPEINKQWLLTGEGDMLAATPTVQQTNVHGDNNAAHTITTSGDTATDKLLDIVTQSQHLATTAQEQTTKAQQHIDRLLAIIEKMQMP